MLSNVREIPADTGPLRELLDSVRGALDPVVLNLDGSAAAVLLDAPRYATLEATARLLAAKGTREAVAEGVADLAAGRCRDWWVVRTEYGRGEPADPAGDGAPQRPVGALELLVSNRTCWDLDLLAPDIAGGCLDALDELAAVGPAAAPVLLGAGLEPCQLLPGTGFGLVIRPPDHGVAPQIVHIAA